MDGREPTPVMKDARIGRGTALVLSVVFGMSLALPAAHQGVSDLRQNGRWRILSLFREWPTHDSLKSFEETLARESILGRKAREAYQTLMTGAVRQGNEKILVGRDGFLFFRPEVEMSSGPGFLSRHSASKRGTDPARAERKSSDPVGAIADYHSQLSARGIHLVFVPVPVKPVIYPEKVWPGYPASSGPAWNSDLETFKSKLAQAGVDLVDVTDDLWKAKSEPGGDLYLRLDTHWTPRGLAVVADRLAAHLKGLALGPPQEAYTSSPRTLSNFGDLLRLIDIPPESGLFRPQSIEITQLRSGIPPVGGDGRAPLLLLGDSFTNVFSRKELEWGERAGLGEQLMLRLGLPVEILALNGGGATSVRELLAQKPASLRGKKAVVWACSARDLFDEAIRWEAVPLPEELP